MRALLDEAHGAGEDNPLAQILDADLARPEERVADVHLHALVGKNIGEWMKAGTLPKTVSKFGTKAEEIFVSYEELKAKFGKDVENLPLGAVGIFTATQKLRTGLQQLMAGSRNFNLSTITRQDLMSLTEECESVTGIPYVMRAYRKEAEKILAQ